ncbi:MAG: M4 family metallopeptidase [Bacteroidales bacterium]|jgi:hypothetical protein|nr:M4 family metallopeptidase [Bacteroidales bacterium]
MKKQFTYFIFFAMFFAFATTTVKAQTIYYYQANLNTFYYGNKTDIFTYKNLGGAGLPHLNEYQLRSELAEAMGQSYSYYHLYYDADNDWTIAEHQDIDQHAQDALWGAHQSRLYFKNKFGRESFNNDTAHPGDLKVIVDDQTIGYNSSAWYNFLNCDQGIPPKVNMCDGLIQLGRRANGFSYMTAIDVIAYEYAHGIDKFTSQLGNALNSGMSNVDLSYLAEGFSDIWAIVVEHEYVPDAVNNWKIGELPCIGSDQNYSCFRNIANPNDSYARDALATHYAPDEDWQYQSATFKSGIFTRWFYYLINGVSLDCEQPFAGISWDAAASIVYRTQIHEMNNFNDPNGFYGYPNFDYPDVRVATLAAATYLFPNNTAIVSAIKRAWDAVGVTDGNDPIWFENIWGNYIISANTTWEEDVPRMVYGTITVNPGVTLTVEGNVYFMTTGGKLTVKQGATLRLNGGHLAPCIAPFWQGVVVEGHPTNLTLRGTVVMLQRTASNNVIKKATIEKARIGINVPHNNTIANGLISATNGVFLNNEIGVSITATNNTTNNSSFTNCLFKVDQNFDAPNLNANESMVYLTQIKGVNFKSCNFIKENATRPQRGISAHNSGFTVKSNCDIMIQLGESCPEQYLTRSYFSGFDRAILAENNGVASNTFSVTQALFENNRVGIEASGVNNEWILQNIFKIGYATDPYTAGEAFGVKLKTCKDYRVEENSFSLYPNTFDLHIGVYVENSGADDNEIYKNYFEDLAVGQRLVGQNRNCNISGKTGLQFLCNQFENSGVRDVEVLCSVEYPQISGIRQNQGGAYNHGNFYFYDYSAGNTFSLNPKDYHFYNETQFGINYYYNPAIPRENPTLHWNFISTWSSNPNSCPSKINTGSIAQESYLEELLTTQASADEAYNAMEYVYNNLIDDGSTEDLLNQVQGSWGDDVWKLRQELMSTSPYLSQEVLIQVANDNLLPQALYLEVCLANPDATKDGKFLDLLAYDIPNPLPTYMLNLIKENGDIKTVRSSMEAVLSASSAESNVALNHYIGYMLMDSIDHSADVTARWSERGTYSDAFALATDQLSLHEYTAAYDLVNSLLDNPKYVEYYEDEITDFLDYILYRATLHNAEVSVYELDSLQLAALVDFSNAHSGIAKSFADNILCYTYDICPEEIQYVEPKRLTFSNSNKTDNKFDNFFMKIKPNPADTYCEFEWNFGDMDGEKSLVITAVNGTTIQTKLLAGSQGQWVWDTRGVIAGFYIYSVYKDGILLESGKIIKR